MNQIFARRLINFLLGNDVFRLGQIFIASSDCFFHFADLCPHVALFNESVEKWTGLGTGISKQKLKHKISIIKSGLKLHGKNFKTVGKILEAFGGREMAAIAGSVIAARIKGIPVLLDGFITTVSAATLTLFKKNILDHCLISHQSSEPGHSGVISHLKKDPILDLNMRLGEGSGAVVASLIIRAALTTHNEMSTFSEAGISKKI